jgi:hypothetical protein
MRMEGAGFEVAKEMTLYVSMLYCDMTASCSSWPCRAFYRRSFRPTEARSRRGQIERVGVATSMDSLTYDCAYQNSDNHLSLHQPHL